MIFPKFQAPWANWTAEAAGALSLRIFLAMVLIVQGMVKFQSSDGLHTGDLPEVEMKDGEPDWEKVDAANILTIGKEDEAKNFLLHQDGEPDFFSPGYAHDWGLKTYGKLIYEETNAWMMPRWAVEPYVTCLPYALLVLGLMVLTGIFGRFAMFVSVFLFASLAYGLFLIQDETAVLMILYVLLAANALFLSAHQRLGLTKL